jgi:outer membrane biosynthesis protein TonB
MSLIKHSVLAAMWLALCMPLAGCESFDPGMLTDWIPTGKKSLAGDRQPVFPQGVPGVSDGVPPELIKGNQPPPEAQAALPEEPPPAEKPKPKPKPKKVANPPPPRQQQSAQPQSSDAPWPAPQPAQSAQPAPSIWPAAPPPGTFSR